MTKLIRCDECTDVVMLAFGPLRTCLCGRSAGIYTDRRTCRVSGPCRVIGMQNQDLAEGKVNKNYVWFVIQEPNDRILRVEVPFVRDPDLECKEYRKGLPIAHPKCEADGHYLCNGCIHNQHRVEHKCKNGGDCAFPLNVKEN